MSTDALDSIRDTDYEQIYQWMNNLDELPLWSGRRKLILYDDFVEHVLQRSRTGFFMVVREPSGPRPIGFLEGSLREKDGTADFLAYFASEWRNRVHTSMAIVRFLSHLFESYPIRKIYCQVYAYNEHSRSLIQRIGFEEEGRFKEYVWWQDRYWDLHVLSLRRSVWQEAQRGTGSLGRLRRRLERRVGGLEAEALASQA